MPNLTPADIQVGRVYRIGPACGEQFKFGPLYLRVSHLGDVRPPDGIWLLGYQLDGHWQAIGKRDIYVPNVPAMELVIEPPLKSGVVRPARRNTSPSAHRIPAPRRGESAPVPAPGGIR